MNTYVILFRFTHQGITHIKDSPKRVEAAKDIFHKGGAQVRSFYMLMGHYDTMFIVDAPDEQTIAKAVLKLGSLGNVRTETMAAFNQQDFQKIISEVD